MNLNEETQPLSANENFLSLIQGKTGRSFKKSMIGKIYDNGGYPVFGSSFGIEPDILPTKEEKRIVKKWSVKYGDIYQKQTNVDQNFSDFIIHLENTNLTTNCPKLGTIVKNVHILSSYKKYRCIDCGIITE